ncbi:phage portal protein [Hydrogenophaga electricum]|uniref:Capsid portal protein n=1 Tax=Hydrogenophaga electricum TaxID=1230953 RepID=A0ABQ6C5F6_9BURK|nr:phage portal protein [Hydrogenophaga electricum]GLS13581.1 capsid portal protein [Hydrogenophaga electricum]
MTTTTTPENTPQRPASQALEVFTFGDPEPALNQTLFDYLGVTKMAEWYEPPISWIGLAKTLRSSAHHGSAIALKRNMLARLLRPHPLLARQAFSGLVYDYLTFGNAFFERVESRTGVPLALRHAMAMYTRAGVDEGSFWAMPGAGGDPLLGYGAGGGERMRAGSVLHLMEPDVTQNIYGSPDYLAALQSAWLNESATLFRRRYYVNGTHAGYILYITDPLHEQVDVDQLKEKMAQSKGPGNFRNLLLYAPGGKGEGKGIQLIHTSEAAAKDEFLRIKSVSRDDVLAAHRVPPQLIGLVPETNGGFGSAKEAMGVFYELEVVPLAQKFDAVNAWFGDEVISFERPSWADLVAVAAPVVK